MTDQELLEKAAKAAGYRIFGWVGEMFYVIHGYSAADNYDPFTWNPLEDDGDALRLMVYLGLEVSSPCIRLDDDQAEAKDYDNNFVCIELADEANNGNPLAATRRAIVRAAASMGAAQ